MSSPRVLSLAALLTTVTLLAGACSASTDSVVASGSTTPAEQSNSATGATSSEQYYFQVLNAKTLRQGGNVVDVYVGVSYPSGAASDAYLNDEPLMQIARNLIAPTAALPADAYWEVVAKEMATAIYASGPMAGASVEVRVHPTCPATDGPPGQWRAAVSSIGDTARMRFITSDAPACAT